MAACGSNSGRASSGAGSLQQWYHQYGEKGTQQAALKFAKAYKDAAVTVQWVPGDYGSKLASGLLSSSAPDVFEDQLNIELIKTGQLAPLDDIFASVKDDFTDADVKLNTYEGKIYGIKMIDDPQFLYYRKSMFQKAGVQPPTTFDELIAGAKKLTNSKTKGVYFGSQNFVVDHIAPYLAAAGTSVVSADHKSNLLTPEVIAAFTKLRELYTSGSVLQSAPTEWTDPSAFIQELVAIQWCGLWALPQIKQAFGDDFGVMAIPSIGAQGKQVVYNGGWSTFVNAKGKNVDAAKKFVKWLWIDQTQYQEEWSLDYGFHIPPRKSVATKATKLQTGQAADAVKLAGQFGIVDDIAFTPKMATAVSDAGNKILRSGADPKAALGTADGIVQSELKRLFG
ncbi:ABC transporter substrate-binding protein [Fodinicola feengrottensis]|nr:sugar ABC transporter substrate-binding protein [Fodinicola feengrottensis]